MYEYKVAVIIPCYNAEKYIARCLESVIKQTFSDLQIIVIDNLSDDSSATIISDFAQADQRIVTVRSHKRGLPYAINDGLAICNAEYVCFVDADDYITNNAVQKLLEAATKYNADVVQCNYCRIWGDGEKEIMNCFATNRVFSNVEIYDATIRMINFYNYMNPKTGNSYFAHSRWAKLIRTDILKANCKIVDLTMSLGEDFDRMLPVFIDSKVIVAINDVLYYYIKNPTSVTLGWAESRKADNVKLIENATKVVTTKGVYDVYRIPLLHKKCQIETDYILRVCKDTCPYSFRRKCEEIKSMRNILKIKGVRFPMSFLKRRILRMLLILRAYRLILLLYRS